MKIENTEYYIEITADDGMRLTDGENIFDHIAYMPLGGDTSIFTEIPEEKAEEILEERLEQAEQFEITE